MSTRGDPLLNRTTTIYDPAGRVSATINGVGDRSTTVYDPASRPQVRINGLGVRTTSVHDAAHREIAVIDGNAQRTTFVYDAAGRKIREVNPLLARLTYSYDAVGRQTLRIDPRGVRVSYAYNAVGKQTGVLYPDRTRATSLYDGVGNRLLAHDSTGRYTRSYDPLNRTVVSIQPSGGRLSFSWDAVGQRRLMVDLAGGRTTYLHDANGNLTRLVNPQGDITTYSYDAAGQRLTTLLANGMRTSLVYDGAGRTSDVGQLKPDGTPIELLQYAYDHANRRIQRTDLEGDRTTWTYDHSGQLIGEHQTGSTSFRATYLYDPAGNRLQQSRDGDVTDYTTDAANRLLVAADFSGRTTYSYDAAGNQTAIEDPSGDITTTIWDFDSRQQAVEQPDTSRVTFTYNCDHWRVGREDAVQTVSYQWDKNNLLAELDDAGVVQVQYTNEPAEFGNLLSQVRDGDACYYHFDVQGTTIALTDPTAAVTDQYQHDAWGKEVSTTGTTTNAFRWIGQQGYYFDDELQRHTLRRRQYDAQLGRFFSEDPIRTESGDDNLYRYSKNDPINYSDPSGLGVDWGDSLEGPGPYFLGKKSKNVATKCPHNQYVGRRVDGIIRWMPLTDAQEILSGKLSRFTGSNGVIDWDDAFRSIGNPHTASICPMFSAQVIPAGALPFTITISYFFENPEITRGGFFKRWD